MRFLLEKKRQNNEFRAHFGVKKNVISPPDVSSLFPLRFVSTTKVSKCVLDTTACVFIDLCSWFCCLRAFCSQGLCHQNSVLAPAPRKFRTVVHIAIILVDVSAPKKKEFSPPPPQVCPICRRHPPGPSAPPLSSDFELKLPPPLHSWRLGLPLPPPRAEKKNLKYPKCPPSNFVNLPFCLGTLQRPPPTHTQGNFTGTHRGRLNREVQTVN